MELSGRTPSTCPLGEASPEKVGALQVFTSPSEAWIVQTPNLDLPASPLRGTAPTPERPRTKLLPGHW